MIRRNKISEPTAQEAVTKLCEAIRRELEMWQHRPEFHNVIIPDMIVLSLAEWHLILNRLELR